jgi:hypothetical protein
MLIDFVILFAMHRVNNVKVTSKFMPFLHKTYKRRAHSLPDSRNTRLSKFEFT